MHTYLLKVGNIAVPNMSATADAANNTVDKVIFKNCASFTNSLSKINNRQVNNRHDIDIVMPMYNSIEYSDNYSKNMWKFIAII